MQKTVSKNQKRGREPPYKNEQNEIILTIDQHQKLQINIKRYCVWRKLDINH